jgi:hypothetical protein
MLKEMLHSHLQSTCEYGGYGHTLSVLTKTIDANGRTFDFSRFITDDWFFVANMKLAYNKRYPRFRNIRKS